MVETLLLTATRINTFDGTRPLTNASGFFFERDGRLWLVSSRHVFLDEPTGHRPDRVEIELHSDPSDMAQSVAFSIPLYRNGAPLWRAGVDAGGEIDVAVIELERPALPAALLYRAFTPAHLVASFAEVDVGAALLIVGFPLGFHDTLHHLPVARHAVIASSFGLRFQGKGYFLTDARTHRGTSGAPVVMRVGSPIVGHGDVPWMLLGVHSSRLDVGHRDVGQDEALGLNSAWYADVLLTLTAD
jgi:hypothetical protein